MALMAEAWALGIRRVEWRGGLDGLLLLSRWVRRVNANAPSSPPVMSRVLEWESGMAFMALMLLWWILVRECQDISVGGVGEV